MTCSARTQLLRQPSSEDAAVTFLRMLLWDLSLSQRPRLLRSLVENVAVVAPSTATRPPQHVRIHRGKQLIRCHLGPSFSQKFALNVRV
ncbi:hypothetical protein MRX96_044587 [Rhipicephalus microplus]